MATGSAGRFRQSVLSGIIVAVVGGAIALLVNLYATASAYRANLGVEYRLREQRITNLLIMIRDELRSVDRSIGDGTLTMSLDGGRLVRIRGRWPTQMWAVVRASPDLLTLDSQLILMLTSVYDEVFRLESLVSSGEMIETMAASMGPFLAGLIESEPNPRVKEAVERPSPQLEALLNSYSKGLIDLRPRLQAVLAALDLQIGTTGGG